MPLVEELVFYSCMCWIFSSLQSMSFSFFPFPLKLVLFLCTEFLKLFFRLQKYKVRSHSTDLYCVSKLSLWNYNLVKKVATSIFIKVTFVDSCLWSRTPQYRVLIYRMQFAEGTACNQQWDNGWRSSLCIKWLNEVACLKCLTDQLCACMCHEGEGKMQICCFQPLSSP